MPLTVGTAGHVDHGKTWLVRALTGKDTDRLPEERVRGMSIDLGYAPLELDDGSLVSLIDVPGHERFIRNMVAGATGIDVFLLVIDAREGPRPQTHEHLQILRFLGIDRGVVAVTKADSVPPESLAKAVEEARGLVPGSEAIPVSAATGTGILELRAALRRAAAGIPARSSEAPTRLFVDRAFSLRGIGTIATGTLWSGTIGVGDRLLAEPGAIPVRVRSVEVHDAQVERAEAGQRVAVAVPRISPDQLRRGSALVAPGAYRPTRRLEVELEHIDDLPARLTVHHGSGATAARVKARGSIAALRLDDPFVAAPGDRVLLRADTTLGAGVVLERRDEARPAPAPVTTRAPLPDDGRVRLPNGHVLDRADYERARELIIAQCELDETITLARARDVLGTNRRLAQAILERLDGDKVTLRIGDVRRLRRATSARRD